MAENKQNKKPKEKTMKDSTKKMDISPVAIVDNIVFSKTEITAYYRISNAVFDFLSKDQKMATALRLSNGFNSLMTDKQEPVDGHVVITSVPFDVESWVEQTVGMSEGWGSTPGFDDYITEQAIYLSQKGYQKKVTYLGIVLGRRGALDMSGLNVFESGFKGALETLQKWLTTALQVPTESISAKEEDEARRKEAEIFRILSNGSLSAERITTESILMMIKDQFYPAMRTPYLDVDPGNRVGPGDLSLETASVIENKYRWLKISQMLGKHEVTGYRATLSFAKFPQKMTFPYMTPFLYAIRSVLYKPYTCYIRFTLHPNQKMKLELEKKKKEQKDEWENLASAQNAADSVVDGLPAEVLQSLEGIQELEAMLAQDKTPWVEASYRVVVESKTEEMLKSECEELKQAFASAEVILQWSSGDQKELFLEQMPGDRHRVKSFQQLTNLHMLSTSGMNFSSDVGDPIYGTD